MLIVIWMRKWWVLGFSFCLLFFCLVVFLFCTNQMSEGSQVSEVAHCVQILKWPSLTHKGEGRAARAAKKVQHCLLNTFTSLLNAPTLVLTDPGKIALTVWTASIRIIYSSASTIHCGISSVSANTEKNANRASGVATTTKNQRKM